MGDDRWARRGGGGPLSTPRQRSPPPVDEDDWFERMFADGSGVWDLFVVVFYLPVIVGGLLWLHHVGGEWLIWDRMVGDQPAMDAMLGCLIGAGLVTASWLAERTGPGARAVGVLRHYLGQATWPGIVAIAASSALGEELLFRAVLQPVTGLVGASLLFAAAHVPFRREMWPWTVQALLHGLLLGFAYDLSEALVVPIVAHGVFNATQLVRFKLAQA